MCSSGHCTKGLGQWWACIQELRYDLTTTVSEAIEQLSAKINLQNYSTFALFESSKAAEPSRSGALTGEVGGDENVLKDLSLIHI